MHRNSFFALSRWLVVCPQDCPSDWKKRQEKQNKRNGIRKEKRTYVLVTLSSRDIFSLRDISEINHRSKGGGISKFIVSFLFCIGIAYAHACLIRIV